jgi:deazaflavin-dependent oxidoreductase (nitroreductase family)
MVPRRTQQRQSQCPGRQPAQGDPTTRPRAFRPYFEHGRAETVESMRGPVRNALRLFTRTMRPLALRSAGKEGSSTSVVRHVGRRSGQTYQTPVIAVRHDDRFLIALPYGHRTDWLKNVLGTGSATIVTNGHAYEVDRPEVIPMAEASASGRKSRAEAQTFPAWTRCRAHFLSRANTPSIGEVPVPAVG